MKKILLVFLLIFTQGLLAGELMDISIEGISKEEVDRAKKNKLAPRGSASLTGSGELVKVGIKGIAHAATGSMMNSGADHDPSLKSIDLSIKNSILVSKKNGMNCVAFPLLGGGIFLGRMGVTSTQLIEQTVKSLNDHSLDMKVVLVGYGADDFKNMQIANGKVKDSKVEVKHGSITDFKVHGCEVIVNAANTELVFGGGLSGVIGRASKKSEFIDKQNKTLIQKLSN